MAIQLSGFIAYLRTQSPHLRSQDNIHGYDSKGNVTASNCMYQSGNIAIENREEIQLIEM
jgi:hypothetical protein